MPTYEGTPEFWRDYNRLTPAQRRQFLAAVKKFVYDLKTGDVRAVLRIRDFRHIQGMQEMT